ncbi:MAG: ATP-binding protein [Thermodesulfobacteriota bacterium]|nr:ATP-binding protein [Thermodesulfobacteriota bacterium]
MQFRWLDIKVKKFLVLVLCAFVLISGIIGYLNYSANQEIERIVNNQFNQQQLIIARKIAENISNHFDFLQTQLLFINQAWHQGRRSTEDIKTYMSSIFPLLIRWHVLAVAHVREQDNYFVAFSEYGFSDVGKLGIDLEMYQQWSKDPLHHGKSIIGPTVRPESGLFKGRLLMVVGVPVWKISPQQSTSGATFEGFSFVLVDPIAIAQTYTSGIYSGKTGYAWIIDHKGTFLAHYEQSFVGEDLSTAKEKKNPSISHERINRTVSEHMLKGEEGTDWYVSGWHRGVIGKMEKLFAYTPVFFSKGSPENLWSVAVTAPMAEVYGIINTAVKRQRLIAGIFQLVVFLCLVMAIYFSLRWSRVLQAEVTNKTANLMRSETEVKRERDNVKESMEKLIEMQDKLIQSERFAAIGEAAAYLSHEIKNPLVVIGGFASQVERSLDENDARSRKKLQLIQDETKRLELMLTEVKDFSRPTKPQKKLQTINPVIEDTVELMEGSLREKGVLCEMSLNQDQYPALIDPQQIKQVLINLLKNALEATPDGGRITIQSKVENSYARVSIVDSGSGIPPEMISKIFNPFYTTKEKGTGLGLAVCRKIIEEHEGEISIQSEEGKGTEIIFILPVEMNE